MGTTYTSPNDEERTLSVETYMMPYRVQFLAFAAATAISGVWGSVGDAQQLASAMVGIGSARIVQSIQGSSSEKRVSLNLQDVSLASALEEIQRSFGVRIVYSRDVVPVNNKVTVTGTHTATDALEQVLVGTGMHIRIMSDGRVMVGRPRTSVVQSAEQGIVVGKVLHGKTRQPVGGASILLDDGVKGGMTSADGTFRVVLSEGEHRITVRAVGFVRHVRTVTVSKEIQLSIEVLLEPSANVLNEVVVTGTVVATERKAIPTPITVIKGEDLEKRGVTRVDQLFRGEIPGLIAIERGSLAYSNSLGNLASSQMYARGSADLSGGTNPIKTYVDGVELLDPSYLGTIDPKSIDRIEVITGPQAATIYGSGAMGGVMQIFTKKGSGQASQDVTVALKYGVLQSNYSNGYTPSHNDAVTLTGGIGPALSYTAGISYVYSGQWQPKLFNRTLGTSLGATHAGDRIRASASLSMTFGANGTWNFSGFDDNYGFLKGLEDGTYGYAQNVRLEYISQQRSTASTQTASLNFDYRQNDAWQHHVTVGRSQNRYTLTPTAPAYAARTDVGADSLYKVSNSNGQRTTISYNTTFLSAVRGITSSATFGGNGSLGNRQNVQGCLATSIATSTIGCFGSSSAPSVNTTLDDESWGGFGSWQVGILGQVYLTLGLRGEHNPTYGKSHSIDWTPTNGLTYTIERGDLTIKLLGSYGKATRPPSEGYRLQAISRLNGYDVTEYVSRFEAPDLRPERSEGPQGGIEIYYGNLGSITINHYSQKVADLIQSVSVDSFLKMRLDDNSLSWTRQSQYQNTATIRQLGWESTGTLNIGYLQLKGTYFWNDSRVLSVHPQFRASYFPGRVFTGVPSHAANATIGYAHGPTSVTLVSNYIGKTWFTWTQDNSWTFDRGYARLQQYVDRITSRTSIQVRHDAYVKSDLAVNHRIHSRVSLTANIINLNNSFASESGPLNPALGRQSTFGITIR